MRQEYVDKLLSFSLTQPYTNEGIEKINRYALELGATQEEVTAALKQAIASSLTGNSSHTDPGPAKKQQTEPPDPMMEAVAIEEMRELKEEILAEGKKQAEEQMHAFTETLAETKHSLIETFDKEMIHHAQNLPNTQPGRKRRRLSKQNLTSGISLAGAVSIFLVSLFISTRPPEQTQLKTHATAKQDASLIQRVFASNEIVDPEEVFSFPGSSVTLVATGTPHKTVFGFLPYWMLPAADKISLLNVTTVALFGLEMDGSGNIIQKHDGSWDMYTDPNLTAFITRAKRNHIKLQYTLKMFNNENIEHLVQSNDAQKRFISNAIYIVQSKNLNGINLDFEYLGDPPNGIREGFTRLVQNLKAELKRQIPGSELTIDTYITSGADPKLFDISALTDFADALIIMGYDMHTPLGDPGPIAPMESEIGIIGLMQSYLDKAPAEKLVLAVPYYGYDWAIPHANDSGATIVSYAEAASQSTKSTMSWDDVSQTPWYEYTDANSKTTHRVYYENTRSLSIKYDFVNNKHLQGIGIWALGYDGYNKELQSLIADKFGR